MQGFSYTLDNKMVQIRISKHFYEKHDILMLSTSFPSD